MHLSHIHISRGISTAVAAASVLACTDATAPQPESLRLQASRVKLDGYVVIDLGTLGGSRSWAGSAGAINDRGQVVGGSVTAGGELHAFLWDRGVMIDLGVWGDNSRAEAVNERGQVIGTWSQGCGPGCLSRHGFLWEQGVVTNLEMIPAAINNTGQIIGDAGGNGFVWERGVKTGLGPLTVPLAINNAGQIVGSNGVYPVQAYIWERGVTSSLGSLGGGVSQAMSINSLGQVVGNATTSSGDGHAFLWDRGQMTDLGSFSVEPGDIMPGGINDRGQIAGVSHTATGSSHAVLWYKGSMKDLGVPSGAVGSVGWVLNSAGEMIGTYEQDGDEHAFVWANGVMIRLPELDGAGGSWPAGINNVGQIAGTSGGHAVLWERRR